MARPKQRKRVQRDYSRKRYENPNRPEKSAWNFRWKKWMLPVGLIGVIVGWSWFLFFSNSFRINDIQVLGSDRIQEWEIRDALEELMSQKYAYIIPKRSLLLLPEKEMRAYLLSHFVLDDVEIMKDPPHGLHVTIHERVSTIFMLLPNGSQAMLDLDGIVVKTYRPEDALEISRAFGPTREVQKNPAEGLPILFIDKSAPLTIHDETISSAVVQAVILIPGLIEETFGSGLRSDEIHIKDFDSMTLRVITTEGWSIYLDAEHDVAEQIKDARTVIQGKLGDNRHTLEHVDVRFGEKIFIKTK